MRDLIQPFMTEYLSEKISLTELTNFLLDCDLEIAKVYINIENRICFQIDDLVSTASYIWEIK